MIKGDPGMRPKRGRGWVIRQCGDGSGHPDPRVRQRCAGLLIAAKKASAEHCPVRAQRHSKRPGAHSVAWPQSKLSCPYFHRKSKGHICSTEHMIGKTTM